MWNSLRQPRALAPLTCPLAYELIEQTDSNCLGTHVKVCIHRTRD